MYFTSSHVKLQLINRSLSDRESQLQQGSATQPEEYSLTLLDYLQHQAMQFKAATLLLAYIQK